MQLRLTHLRPARPLCAVDLETTGLDPTTARVVEVAALKVGPGVLPGRFHTLVHPGGPIPPAAAAVHGILDRDVEHKPRFEAIAADLYDFLTGCDLVAYNAAFDLAILAAEFARAGRRFKVRGRAVLDPLALFRRHEPHTLAHAVRFYLGADHPGTHSAAADAAAALRVLDAQVGLYGLPTAPADLRREMSPVDVAGRFGVDAGGRVLFGFGKHRGRPVGEVAAAEPSYLRWVLANVPLLDDAAEVLNRALAGQPVSAG